MTSLRQPGLAVLGVIMIASGCQTIPPQPLELGEVHASIEAQELDVEPVREYADALSEDTEDGQEFEASDGLSLREAQAVALWYNTELRVARLELARAASVAGEAGRWLDPEFGLSIGRKSLEGDTTDTVSIEDAGEAVSFSRTNPDLDRAWILAGSLSITLPLSGRLKAQRELAGSRVAVAALTVAEAEWETLAEVREAWLQWSASRARLDLLDEHLATLERITSTAQALADAGELLPSSARLFSIERLRVEAERVQEAALASELRTEILAALGLLPDAEVELLPQLELTVSLDAEWPDPAEHPTLARLRAAYDEAEARLRLELRKQYPDLTFSPTYTDEKDETSLVLGLGMPVPVWNANREGIADAAGARDVARAQVIAVYQDLLARRAQAQARFEGLRAQRERLVKEVGPLIDEQLVETRALLDIGELDVIVLYETLTQALQTKQTIVSASLAEALAAASLIQFHASDIGRLNHHQEMVP